MDYTIEYRRYFDIFEAYAHGVFDKLDGNDKLLSAMRYGLMNGGKRVRAVLMLAFAEIFGADVSSALPFALAIECIHAYSLIHDDLPALDNDDLRRGKPSNHVVYGEDFAIIAGDALQNLAYEILFGASDLPEKLAAAKYIAECSGYSGMIGGQAYDLMSEGKTGEDELYRIDFGKTCKLIQAPVVAAALLAGKDPVPFESFGRDLGLLFQFTDDLLDEIGEESKLGKTVGKDKQENKLTAVSVYGLDGAKKEVQRLESECLAFLSDVGGAEFLRELVIRLSERDS